ncbi:MAG TPA: proton-conducting transporter membrane subunit [Solirubrobacteraceae bacterium]|jgi:multicomponent Na+:H+ antiporter subunit D
MVLTSLAILVPLLTAVVLAATTSLRRRRAADVVALAAAATVVGLCVALVVRASDKPVVAWLGGWHPRNGVALGIDLYADQLGAGLAAFAGVLAVAGLLVAWHQVDVAGHLFHALVLVVLAGMVGFCLAGDLFTAFVFFELMGVSAYALAGFRVQERAPLEGALNFAVTNSVGSLLLLVGIALLYGRTGALNLAQIGEALAHHRPDALVAVAFALVACGFFVKAAIVPFHFWLADAYAVAPTSICLIFAGALSELGLYGIARVYWTVFSGPLEPHAETVRDVLLVLGLATALIGGAMCAAQRHLKRMVAFATVGHMGILLCGVALLDGAALAGVAVFVVGDGLVKAGMFVAVGGLEHRRGSVDEHELYGRGRDLHALGVLFCVCGLALAAMPPFGPFVGRAMIEDAATHEGLGWVSPVLVVASALIGGAVLRVVRTVFLGRGPKPPRSRVTGASESGDEPIERGRAPLAGVVASVMLVALGLLWGLVPGLIDAVTGAAAHFVDRSAYAAAVLHDTAPRPPGTPGEGLTTAAWLYGAASAALAVVIACMPTVPVGALRDLHSGRVGDYVAWLAAGTALVAGVFALTLP